MLDNAGYRLGVGMVIRRRDEKVLWCKRTNLDMWQFPQGGIEQDELPETAMWRELQEEVGLLSQHTQLIQTTDRWLHYDFPKELKMTYKGQKQIWFLLQLLVDDSYIDLATANEFDQWHWVDWWHPLEQIVAFKQEIYRQVLESFSSPK